MYQHHVTLLKMPFEKVSVSWQNISISENWCSPEKVKEMGIYPVLRQVIQSSPTSPFPTLNTKQNYQTQTQTPTPLSG